MRTIVLANGKTLQFHDNEKVTRIYYSPSGWTADRMVVKTIRAGDYIAVNAKRLARVVSI